MRSEGTTRPIALHRALVLNARATTTARAVGAVATNSVVTPPASVGALHVAVVHSADGVRFATAAASRTELVERLAEYVRRRAPRTLWPADARYVRSLLIRGELEAAVEVYFGRVGDRWDREWLATTAIITAEGLADRGATAAVAGG